MKDKKLALFLELGGSLRLWEEVGFIDREARIYNELAKNFNSVYIFTYGNKEDQKYSKYFAKNIKIFPKKYSMPNFLYEFLLPFCYFKKVKEADIYKTNQNSGSLAPVLAKIIFSGKKLVIRSGFIGSDFAHMTNYPRLAKIYFYIVENLGYRFCDKAFTPTQNYFDLLMKKYSFLQNKLILMGNSIDAERFLPKNLSKDYDIIYVARLNSRQKNHFLLLKSLVGTNLRLLLIGQGEEQEKIKLFVMENNLSVEIIAKVPNNQLAGYYNSAKLCVFPSLHEGNPKALLEAMACGLPVVGLAVSGVENIIIDNVNGIIASNNPKNVSEKVQLLLGNGELYKKISSNARNFVVENYSLDKLLKKEIEIYENFS